MSDDAVNFRLQQAAHFMAEVRGARFESGRSLGGLNYLGPGQQYAISEASQNSSIIASVKTALEIDLPLNKMFERFEEMCRREKITIDPALRPDILRLLSVELWANIQQFGGQPKNLTSVTIYCHQSSENVVF